MARSNRKSAKAKQAVKAALASGRELDLKNDFRVDGQTGDIAPRDRTVPEENRKPKPEPMPGH